jgi:hypothetical protein
MTAGVKVLVAAVEELRLLGRHAEKSPVMSRILGWGC